MDHGHTIGLVHLYMNESGYNAFNKRNLPHTISKQHQPDITMKSYLEIVAQKSGNVCLPDIDYYPTYSAYESLMYDFEKNYPDICRIINIGTLASGRKILVAQIGDSFQEKEDEPNFFYTSTMHGDETGGYPLMIKLIDHLLCNYGNDDRLTRMVNEINIFINPLANPNGTYRGGDDTVESAIRYNSTFSDLNRNFPDPEDGEHPDNRDYQEETEIFMAFADDYNIQLSCNIHGGIEVANYPWDTFQHLPADVSWWEEQCRSYADTVQSNSPANYFKALNNGVTNGYAWYEVQGGRQDYMTYFKRAREFTLEISNRKLVNSDDLPMLWNANRAALLNYMESSLHGLRGVIVDCNTGDPLKAEIIIPGHDEDNSSVYSESELGSYFRYLDNGTYDLIAVVEGYDTLYFTAQISDKQSTRYDVMLCPEDLTSVTDEEWDMITLNYIDHSIYISNLPQGQNFDFAIYNTSGQLIHSTDLDHRSAIDFTPENSGIFLIQISSQDKVKSIPVYIN